MSKPENRFYEALREKFGVDDVKRQVPINDGRWTIDFHTLSIDAYVQLDGVYWHGLNRPIDAIRKSALSGHRRDIGTYRKWLVDRQQVEWFASRGLCLVRIIDQEFKVDSSACLLNVHEAAFA